MNMGIVTLIVLFLVIVVGFWRKLNIGLIAIAAAVCIGYGSGTFSGKQIISGFNSSLFMTLLGVMLLFGLVQANGCLEVVMHKAVHMLGHRIWLAPVMMYVIGWVLSAIGPGCVPALAFVAAVAIPLAHKTGYNPIMLMLIGDVATYSGRFTAITPEGVLVTRLLEEQGFSDFLVPIVLNTAIGGIILSVSFYLFYKGYAVVKTSRQLTDESAVLKTVSFTRRHVTVLCGVAAMVLGVLVLRMDVGLASFLVAMALLVVGIGDEKDILRTVPWGTLIMVCGVGVLMNLVIVSGGIKQLASAMASVMSPGTTAALTALTAGVMSWFSSTMGVVLPTILPTVGQIVETVGGSVSVVEVVSAVCIVSSCAGFSPASTVGAMIISAYEADPVFREQTDARKLFVELFAWSIFCVLFLCSLAWIGLFGLIA